LLACRVSKSTVSRWAADGYLYEELPRVYIVGHRAPSLEGDLTAAILYAGPGAMLSHGTAACWWGLTDRRPAAIEVSTPRRCRSRPGIKVHGRRELEMDHHKRLPVTTIPQTVLDYASAHPIDDVLYVLAEADYHRVLDLEKLRAIAGQGRAGTTTLRKALDHHWPELARTRSRVERAFLFLCEEAGLPRPQVNAKLFGLTVDIYWPEYRLVVELDGAKGHSTERQVARDHGRDLILRRHGIRVRRYAEAQVLLQGEMVRADLIEARKLVA
jgi:very-short-patch-repair endonuclease